MTEGFDHMILYRLAGDGELFCNLFIGLSVDPAEDKDLFPHRGKGAGQRMKIIGFFEIIAGRSFRGDLLLCRPYGQLGKHFPLGVLLTEKIDKGGAGNIE